MSATRIPGLPSPMPFRIEHPQLLWFMLVAVVVLMVSMRSLKSMDTFRRRVIVMCRAITLLTAVLALSGVSHITERDDLTVIAVVDVSGSVQRFADLPSRPDEPLFDNLRYLKWWLRSAAESRRLDDRFGLVVFDGGPYAVTTPVSGEYNDDQFEVHRLEGTNIAEAIRFALALFPPDTSRRLVLLSDGVETAGRAIDAAREAAGSIGVTETGEGILYAENGPTNVSAGGIPIDVVPIVYQVDNEVILERIDVPTQAMPGENISVRVLLRSTSKATGRLTLLLEDQPIDLNGPNQPGLSRVIDLKSGINVETILVPLGREPINRFRAFFEPAEPSDEQVTSFDTLADNNAAEAFTVTPRRGTVLVLDGVYDGAGSVLPRVLEESGLHIKTVGATSFPTSPLELNAYDLVILQNVPAEDLSESQQTMLVQYVRDLGGGLMMVGGYDSCGAGGWIDTPIADILPVEMEIPEELQVPAAAIAIVLDKSGSMNMPVMGTRKTQQEIANEGAALAVESLDSKDYLTVITFNYGSHTVIPLSRIEDIDQPVEKILGIRSGGGTNLYPALSEAYESLRNLPVDIKHVVCLSDGQSEGRNDFESLIQKMRADGITISAIAVGDDADTETLRGIASGGGGEFYSVRNPRVLPRIFVKDVRVIRRPLIREKEFTPIVRATGSIITEQLGSVPALQGLVLTQPLRKPGVELLMMTPDGEPILARQPVGLGQVAAFTSDAHNNWAEDWVNQSAYETLWTQTARATSRPAGTSEYELTTTIENDELTITLDSSPLDLEDHEWLSVPGVVYGPNGEANHVRLRPVGPALHSATIPASASGNYVTALTPRLGSKSLGIVVGGTNRRSGIEYRRLSSDDRFMRHLGDITGGRLLDVHDPQATALFSRAGLPPAIGVNPLWPILLWIAIITFLVDVAARRLAWDARSLKAFGGQIAHLTSARTDADSERAEAAMQTLRKADERIQQRTEAQRGRIAKSPDDTETKQEPDRIETETDHKTPLTSHTPDIRKSTLADQVQQEIETQPTKPTPSPSPEERRKALEALGGETSGADKEEG